MTPELASGCRGALSLPFVGANMRWKLAGAIFLAMLGVGIIVSSALLLLSRTNPVEGKIVMATGNRTYHDLAATYRADLEANGVSLELRDTTEGFATLQALADD